MEFRTKEADMLEWLLWTESGVVGLILRLTLAVVIFPHGAHKVFGWFGGYGFKGTMKYFADSGVPTVFAVLVMASELLGPLGLAVGLLARVAAFGIASVMIGAIIMVHWPHGFFMNWFGNQKGEGFEYYLLALGIAIALIVGGAGVWSIDGTLAGAR
jgi:putative oxidoreductase